MYETQSMVQNEKMNRNNKNSTRYYDSVCKLSDAFWTNEYCSREFFLCSLRYQHIHCSLCLSQLRFLSRIYHRILLIALNFIVYYAFEVLKWE